MAGENNLSFELEVRGVSGVVHGLTEVNKAIKEITKSYIQANQSGDLQGMVRATNELKKALDIKTNIQAFSRGMLDVSGNIGATAQSSRNAAMAMLNLNYVIRDSPYFFNNFAMGVLAVGNNLNPLIDSMIRVKQEARAMGVTFGSLMRQTFLGTSGVIFALSMAVAAFQAITFAMQDSKKEAKETKTELEKLEDVIKRMSRTRLERAYINIQSELFALERAVIDRGLKVYTPVMGPGGEILRVEERILSIREALTDKERERYDLLIAASKMLEDEKRTVGDIENLRREIAEIEKERDSTVGLTIEKAQRYKKLLDEKNAQLDLLLQKEVKRTEEKEKQIDLLDKLIVSDAELLKSLKEHDLVLSRTNLSERERNELWKQRVKISNELFGLKINLPDELPEETAEPLGDVPIIDKDLEVSIDRLKLVNRVANVAGNAISNAFLSGKNAIDAAAQALREFIIQLMVVQTLKGVLNVIGGGTFLEGFLSFANGGIVPKADNGMIVPGSSYSGDKVLVRVNSGEMILNKQQQRNLFDMISGAKFGGGGMQKLKIDIGGKIEAKQDKFVIDFKKAERRVNKYLTT